MLTLKYYISKKKGKVYCSTLDIEDDNSFQPYMETNIPVDLVKELYSLASKDEELAFNACHYWHWQFDEIHYRNLPELTFKEGIIHGNG